MIPQHTGLFLFNLIAVVSGCQLWTNCNTASYGQLLNVTFDPPGCNGMLYAWQWGTTLTLSISFKTNQEVENAQLTLQGQIYKVDCNTLLFGFPYTLNYSPPLPYSFFPPKQICPNGNTTSICPLQPNQAYNVTYTYKIPPSIIAGCYQWYVNITAQIEDQSTGNSIACVTIPAISEGPPYYLF